MTQAGIRQKRLSTTIQKHLSAEISRELSDPRLAALLIESVEVTPDLGLVTVRVRLMIDDSAQARKEIVKLLSRLSPMLRSRLAPVLKMRRVPELRFFYDEGLEQRERIEQVLSEIRAEDKPNEG